MPIQPRPRAETVRPLRPSSRVFMTRCTFEEFGRAQRYESFRMASGRRALHLDASDRRLDLTQIVRGEGDVRRAQIFFDPLQFTRAEDRDNERLARQQPSKR